MRLIARILSMLSITTLSMVLACGDDIGGDAGSSDVSVDAPVTCGNVTCAEGLVCCNASCGICVLPSESCTNLECVDGGTRPDVSSLDQDGDGVPDIRDNCMDTVNAEQRDFDGDLQGDECDSDADGDGVEDAVVDGFLSRAQVLDYFTQDVCLTDTGEVSSEDPATCVLAGMRIRNHRPGEPLPYMMFESDDTTTRSSRSYRMPGRADNSVTVSRREVSPHLELNVRGAGNLPLGQTTVFEMSPQFAKLIYSGSVFGNQYTFAEDCTLNGGWNIVELDRVSSEFAQTSGVLTISFQPTCVPMLEEAYVSEWRIENVDYGGRELSTLRVTSSWTTTRKEFFFTREYGLTREAFWRKDVAPAISNCPGDDTDSEGFARTFCIEHATPVAIPGGHDLRSERTERVSSNELVHGDLGRGDTTDFRVFSDGNVALSIGNDDSGLRAGNHHLVARWTGSGAASFFQDVLSSGLSVGRRYEFGAYLSASGDAIGRLVVHQLTEESMILETAEILVNLDPTPVLHESSLMLRSDTHRLRFEMYLTDSTVDYVLDNAFIIENDAP